LPPWNHCAFCFPRPMRISFCSYPSPPPKGRRPPTRTPSPGPGSPGPAPPPPQRPGRRRPHGGPAARLTHTGWRYHHPAPLTPVVSELGRPGLWKGWRRPVGPANPPPATSITPPPCQSSPGLKRTAPESLPCGFPHPKSHEHRSPFPLWAGGGGGGVRCRRRRPTHSRPRTRCPTARPTSATPPSRLRPRPQAPGPPPSSGHGGGVAPFVPFLVPPSLPCARVPRRFPPSE